MLPAAGPRLRRLTGRVASDLSWARLKPTRPPREMTMAGFAPPSAWAPMRTRALRFASVSSRGIIRASEVAEGAALEAALDLPVAEHGEAIPLDHRSDGGCGDPRPGAGCDERGKARIRQGAEDLVVVAAGQNALFQARLHRERGPSRSRDRDRRKIDGGAQASGPHHLGKVARQPIRDVHSRAGVLPHSHRHGEARSRMEVAVAEKSTVRAGQRSGPERLRLLAQGEAEGGVA